MNMLQTIEEDGIKTLKAGWKGGKHMRKKTKQGQREGEITHKKQIEKKRTAGFKED